MSTFADEADGGEADENEQRDAECVEVHAVGDWTLVVRANGAVEARSYWDNGDPMTFTTAPEQEAPEQSATYRYGLSIEQVLARYTYETRFERDPNEGEHGAALRRGIIEALCALAPATFPDGSDGQPVGVVFVNAPTGPSTSIVSEDASTTGTYATLHPFETGEQ